MVLFSRLVDLDGSRLHLVKSYYFLSSLSRCHVGTTVVSMMLMLCHLQEIENVLCFAEFL